MDPGVDASVAANAKMRDHRLETLFCEEVDISKVSSSSQRLPLRSTVVVRIVHIIVLCGMTVLKTPKACLDLESASRR